VDSDVRTGSLLSILVSNGILYSDVFNPTIEPRRGKSRINNKNEDSIQFRIGNFVLNIDIPYR
jgi:hypothetical protein